MLRFQSYKPKSTVYPYVLFLAMAAILVGWTGHRTHFLKLNTSSMIVAKFDYILSSSFRGEDFCKKITKLSEILTIKDYSSLRGKLIILVIRLICRSYFAEHYCIYMLSLSIIISR